MRGGTARSARGLVGGYVAVVVLTLAAFGLVAWGGLGRGPALGALGALALAQIGLQLRLFLHLDLSRARRDDLVLVAFAALLIGIMAGGGFWVLMAMDRMGMAS